MERQTLTILGTKYELVEDETVHKEDADGIVNPFGRQIRIAPKETMLCGKDPASWKKARYNEVLRHEIVHALLHESGMSEYCDDEKLVDWIARIFPRMLDVFKEMKCTGR